jgi:hypothetical protein
VMRLCPLRVLKAFSSLLCRLSNMVQR